MNGSILDFNCQCVLRIDGLTFYEQNRLSMDRLCSKPDRLHSLYGPNERFLVGLHGLDNLKERFYPVTQSDGARLSVLS